jgi:hypothetical protein
LSPGEKAVAVAEQPRAQFRNRLQELGVGWLKDIDRKVARGDNAQTILDWLKRSYKGPVPLPDVKTVRAYIVHVRNDLNVKAGAAVRIRQQTERTEEELRALLSRLQIAEADIGDRKALLERLVRFLLVRTEVIAQVQDNLLDPRFEMVITNHLTLVKSTTDTLLKLEGQIGEHEFIARRIVERFLGDLAPVIKQVAEEMFGQDKLKAFMEKLAKGYARIDWARIKKEAAADAAAHGTQEVLDVVETIRAIPR